MYRRGGRTLHRLALLGLLLGGCILLVIAVSAAYQVVATARERARFPVPGRLIDVGGYRLHLRCAGKGRPAVILESGFGMSSNEWALVHPAVAKFTQVCSYDRTGYGWSESGPRADAIEVLHVLLRNAAIRGPYVLVGHSYGSGLIRRYRYRFPEQVVGMVLTATSYPDEEVRPNASAADEQDRSLFKIYGLCTRTGLLRMIPEGLLPETVRLYFGFLRRYLPSETAECEIAFLYQTRHVQSMVIEREHPTSAEEDEDVAACRRGFGNIPLVVLAERWVYSPDADQREREEARREAERQEKLARLSSRGKHIDVDSGHLIPLERSTVVIDAIRDVVANARQTP